MDGKGRQQLLARYKSAVHAVLVAVDHISEVELDVRPTPRHWSAREAVHHLADAELHEGTNLRRMLAENTPVLVPWDPAHYVERLHYDRPIAVSLDAFRATATANIELLESLTEAQWRREGNQQKPWHLTVESWLADHVTEVHNRLMMLLNAPAGGRVIEDPKDGPLFSRKA
jgi:hypothetical protein